MVILQLLTVQINGTRIHQVLRMPSSVTTQWHCSTNIVYLTLTSLSKRPTSRCSQLLEISQFPIFRQSGLILWLLRSLIFRFLLLSFWLLLFILVWCTTEPSTSCGPLYSSRLLCSFPWLSTSRITRLSTLEGVTMRMMQLMSVINQQQSEIYSNISTSSCTLWPLYMASWSSVFSEVKTFRLPYSKPPQKLSPRTLGCYSFQLSWEASSLVISFTGAIFLATCILHQT